MSCQPTCSSSLSGISYPQSARATSNQKLLGSVRRERGMLTLFLPGTIIVPIPATLHWFHFSGSRCTETKIASLFFQCFPRFDYNVTVFLCHWRYGIAATRTGAN